MANLTLKGKPLCEVVILYWGFRKESLLNTNCGFGLHFLSLSGVTLFFFFSNLYKYYTRLKANFDAYFGVSIKSTGCCSLLYVYDPGHTHIHILPNINSWYLHMGFSRVTIVFLRSDTSSFFICLQVITDNVIPFENSLNPWKWTGNQYSLLLFCSIDIKFVRTIQTLIKTKYKLILVESSFVFIPFLSGFSIS